MKILLNALLIVIILILFVVVNIVRSFPHPVYKKFVKFSKKYYVHDENNKCEKGDTILIEESKPLSRLKRWRVKQITKKVVKV